ncbi:hypothetical protein DIURU_004071 [Diutina rugosa]|uniref:Uncharacterized protein n=1 Tax=Diutina rugosa TaxID=5481 RepID=A0A642UIJ8_DIURU|nr:uncharacterized protein DIURU_004071 [Diutina rugosa]KAA8899814.1 hypothetical protein DIURU_004071 [Diutina rugosa]
MGHREGRLRQCFVDASNDGHTLVGDEIRRFVTLVAATGYGKSLTADKLAVVDTLPRECQLTWDDAAEFIATLSGSDDPPKPPGEPHPLADLLCRWLDQPAPPSPVIDPRVVDPITNTPGGDLRLQSEYIECLEQQRRRGTRSRRQADLEATIIGLGDEDVRRSRNAAAVAHLPRVVRLPPVTTSGWRDRRVIAGAVAVVAVAGWLLRYAHAVASIGAAMPLWAEVYARLVEPGPEFYRRYRYS